MVSKTMSRSRIFSYQCIFDSDGAGGYTVKYYDPDGVTMYTVKLDAASTAQLNALKAQIDAFMNQQDTWSGTVASTWKLTTFQQVSVQKWVQQ